MTDREPAGRRRPWFRRLSWVGVLTLGLCCGCSVADKSTRCRDANRATSTRVHAALHELPPSVAPVNHIRFCQPVLVTPLDPANYKSAEELPISLEETIAISVQQSEIVRTIVGPGQADLIATGFDPTIQEARILQTLAAFDTQLSLAQNWSTDNQPDFPQFDRSSTQLSLNRNFVTGTRSNLTFVNDYSFATSIPAAASYRTRLEFGLAQPLRRGGGVAVNRVPLVIARAQSDSSVWDFKAALQSQVRSVETAYRELYSAQESVRVLGEVFELSQEVVRVQKERVSEKAAVEADLAQAESQMASIQLALLQSTTSMLTNETLLRNLLGWPASDGRRVVAVDQPYSAPLIVDWESTLSIAMQNRPDIASSRLAVLIREQLLVQARNNLMPQADLVALLRKHGEDPSLDDSLSELLGGGFTDGLVGFSVGLPLRNYNAGSAAQAAELGLMRERAVLRQTVHNATHDLTASVRNLQAIHMQYQAVATRLKATETFLVGSRSRFENPRANSQLLLLLSVYLGALSDFANATITANQLLSQYNVATAQFEESKGTLLQQNQIYVDENLADSLPTGLYDQYLRRYSNGCETCYPAGLGAIDVAQSVRLQTTSP